MSSQPKPDLVVYKEIVEGDLRKLRAESNDVSSGGGARDLRLPAKTFRPVMERIFTQEIVAEQGRVVRTTDMIYLDDDGTANTTRLEYWPATDSRPAEDRISKVHKSGALGGRLPDTGRGRVFALFIRFTDGTNRFAYLYEDELSGGQWASEIVDAILECSAATADRNSTRSSSLMPVQGYYDFSTGAQYCHADPQ